MFSKVTEKCRSYLYCRCPLCEDTSLNRYEAPPEETPHVQKLTHETRDFTWLIELLGPLGQSFIPLPETVFYRHGKCRFLYGSKGPKTKFVTHPEQLKPNSLIKAFASLSRKRRKEANQNKSGIYKFTTADLDNEVLGKEIAIVKYRNGHVQVMNEVEFGTLMSERAGSSVWQEILFIQSTVNSRAGIGRCALVEYYEGDRNQLTPLAEALAGLNWKIVYLKAEFQYDDDGLAWLFSVDELRVEKLSVDRNRSLPPIRMRPDSREVLSNSLYLHNQTPRKRVSHLTELMDGYYQKIRQKVDVNKIIGSDYNVFLPKKELPYVVELPKKENKRRSLMIDPLNSLRTSNRVSKMKHIIIPNSVRGLKA